MSTADDAAAARAYPSLPIVGVGGVVLRGDEVLLVERGREPLRGQWSLPGGRLELGETMADGVVREVMEETAVAVRAVEVLLTLDRIDRDAAGRVRYHYVLVDWMCELTGEASEPRAGSDAVAARWVRLEAMTGPPYWLEKVTLELIHAAVAARRSGSGTRER